MAKKQKQTADSLPLVAIDLGSDSVRAMAARRVDTDTLEILGVEEVRKNNCIQNGVITHSAEAGYMISNVLHLLANRIGQTDLPTTFVSLGGRQVQIVGVPAKRDQIRRKEISQALLNDMEQECIRKVENNPGVVVLDLIPTYYTLDGEEQSYPPRPEQRATIVEGYYTAFVSKREFKSQLQKSFDQACKSIEAEFIRQEALLSAFACEDGELVLEEGCAILDLGAQTTTLTVFKGNQYLYHKVVPQGGYHLTRVIEQLGMDWKTAETIKQKYGFASAASVDKNLKLRVKSQQTETGEIVITSEELANVLSLKLEEILNPLMAELGKYANRITRLYLTGGASMLQGIDAYLQQKTSVQVLYGAHDRLLEEATDEMYLQPQYSALVGTLILGSDYRDSHKGEPVKEPGLIDKIKEMTLDIFKSEDTL